MQTPQPDLTARDVAAAPDILRRIKRDHRAHLDATVETLRPLDGFVLFEREPQALTAGRIHLVSKSERDLSREATWARVVKLGEPLRARKTDAPIAFTLRPDDRVLLTARAGHDIVLDHKPYVLAIESDVVLIDDSPRSIPHE